MADTKKIFSKRETFNNSLSYYLHQISKIPLLTRSEEEDLALRAQKDDQIAKDKLIRANLRFVVSVAKKYRRQGLPFSDLVNEGNLGLIKAIERFDVSKGYHFISYAVWWIRQAILKAICEKSRTIRLPLNRANELVQIRREKKRLENESDNDVQADQIADNLSMDKKTVKRLLDISKETISLETPVFERKRESLYLGDFIKDEKYKSPEKNVEDSSLHTVINSLLTSLTEKEKDILELRFGLNGHREMSLKEIGNRFNLTKERIRQIEKKDLNRLRHSSRSYKLKKYFVH
jgi:RNA polymerase primary sigma factor